MALFDRVARRLDVDPDRAETLVREVLDQKRDELRREGSVDLPGVGRLEQTNRGIRFVPEERFAELVDARHAGAEPITLSLDLSESESSDEPEPDPEDPLSGSSQPGPEARGERTEASDEIDEPVWAARSGEPLGKSASPAYEDTSYEVLDETELEGASPGAAPSSEAPDEETSPASDDETRRPSRRTTGRRRPSAADRRKDSSRQTLAIVAGLLILTGSALILYFLWSPGGSPEPTGGDDGPTVDTAATAAAETSTNTSSEATDGVALPLEAPLRSDGSIDPTLGGATWVVGSFSDSSRASSVRASYQSDGYRTVVLPGGNGYRVAVGHFATEQDAEPTRSELPPEAAEGAWILEFDSQQ